MVFSSIRFLFEFLTPVLFVYHVFFFLSRIITRQSAFWRQIANLFLLLVSLRFYWIGETWLVWIVMVSSGIDYLCALVIDKSAREPDRKTAVQKCALVFSIVTNLGFLCYFKYYNFGIDAFNQLVPESLASWRMEDAIKVALPLGISFYTFQSMSYTIDVYRGHVRATHNLIDFAAYVTLFPQLVAGPIVRYETVAQQLKQRTVGLEQFTSGLQRFILGLAKKVLVANMVARNADWIFGLEANELTFSLAWIGLVAYALQIYFDFSGYSDMAIGLGRMLGFEFLENFNYPYIAQSIQDFWRRWHISLSTWFRDYLYIPLGGNRQGSLRTYFNLFVVFFLCGLWHGASWNFIVWGLYHGLFLSLERAGLSRLIGKCSRPLRHGYMVLVVLGGWVLFRCESLAHIQIYYQALLGLRQLNVEGWPADYQSYFRVDFLGALLLGLIFCMPIYPWLEKKAKQLFVRDPQWVHPIGLLWESLIIALFLLCCVFLAGDTFNPFIYFRF